MLYRIIKKCQNKIFWTIGQFEFEYFGGSDVVNKLKVCLQDANVVNESFVMCILFIDK